MTRARAAAAAAASVTIALGALGACGGAASRSPGARAAATASGARDAAAPTDADVTSDAAPAWPTLDDLAARAPSVAAGMREEKRDEVDLARPAAIEIARAEGRDVCARVSLAATRPVHASLEDEGARPPIDGGTAAATVLPPRGPLCVRRGRAIVLRLEPREPSRVRYVAWVSP